MTAGMMPPFSGVRPLQRLSPSRYVALKNCALREVWTAAHTPALLPAFPGARLGSVIHKLLEAGGRGMFVSQDEGAIESAWDHLIDDTETRMRSSWLERSLVPLHTVLKDYGERRARTLLLVRSITASLSASSSVEAPVASKAVAIAVAPIASSEKIAEVSGVEMTVMTNDGRVSGKIDRVYETTDGPVIVDYKSAAVSPQMDGVMTSEQESYRVQLKLYAALYEETTGHWPVRLELVPSNGVPVAIPFTPHECRTLLDNALALLNQTNTLIHRLNSSASAADALASPHLAGCRSCQYRPACTAYRRTRSNGSGKEEQDKGWPFDVWGTVTARKALFNGRVGLSIQEDNGTTVRIRALHANDDRNPALPDIHVGDHVALFNLDGREAPWMYAEQPMTVLYRDTAEAS